jgi:hypothetical protein
MVWGSWSVETFVPAECLALVSYPDAPAFPPRRAGRHDRVVAVTVADVRALALTLPRTMEHLIRDRVKFRVGSLVYCAFSRDETLMGFGFPKEEREATVAARGDVFVMPGQSDLRYNWIVARMAALDMDEMRELVVDAWRMCVPKKVSAAYDLSTSAPL